MLARAVTMLPAAEACAGGCVYEPKWDGWRQLAYRFAGGKVALQSRSGRDLTGYFPEIVRLAREHLPGGVVLDGELIIWSRAVGGRVQHLASGRIHRSDVRRSLDSNLIEKAAVTAKVCCKERVRQLYTSEV